MKQNLSIKYFKAYTHFHQLKLTIMLPRLTLIQQILLNKVHTQYFNVSDVLANSQSRNYQRLNQGISRPVWQSSIYSAAKLEKFTVLPMILDHSPFFHFFLSLETRNKIFLEHSFLAKNTKKLSNFAKFSPSSSRHWTFTIAE